VLTSAPDAGAATVLTTATAFISNQYFSCDITNIDTKPITVAAQLLDPKSGTPETPDVYTCPAPPATLAAGTYCYATAGSSVEAYCVVTASSAKVRAALDVFDGTTGDLEVHIPATK
jgi:hypothetical protein